MNLNHLAKQSDSSEPSWSTRANISSSDKGDNVMFKTDCICCNSEVRKKIKVKGTWTTEGMCHFECDGWKSVLEMAEQSGDEKLQVRIRGQD